MLDRHQEVLKESFEYIPEEYVDDKYDYYSKFLNSNKHYDYIFGHGIIEDGMPAIVSSSHEKHKSGEVSMIFLYQLYQS